jgi:hypothetical protein
MVEGRIGERQGTRVADLEVEARIVILALRVLDIHRREIQAAHAPNLGVPGQTETETPGAAPDIQDALGPDDPGEVDEQRCEAAAPAPHLQLVPVAIS